MGKEGKPHSKNPPKREMKRWMDGVIKTLPIIIYIKYIQEINWRRKKPSKEEKFPPIKEKKEAR